MDLYLNIKVTVALRVTCGDLVLKSKAVFTPISLVSFMAWCLDVETTFHHAELLLKIGNGFVLCPSEGPLAPLASPPL
jgi:hypothetical protein